MIFAAIAAEPAAVMQGNIIVEYASLILGIFIFMAFLIVTIILNKYKLDIGPWIIIAFAALFITASEFSLLVIKNIVLHQFMIFVGFMLLFFAAIFKYWDIMELTQ